MKHLYRLFAVVAVLVPWAFAQNQQMVQFKVILVWSSGGSFSDKQDVKGMPGVQGTSRDAGGSQPVSGNAVSNMAIRIAVLNDMGQTVAEASPNSEGVANYRFPGTATVSTYGGEVRGIAVLSDGSIIAAGETYKRAYVDNDVHSCTLLFKLSANGTLDPTFGNGGSLCFDFAPEVPDTTYFQHNSSIAIGTGDLLYLTTPQTNLSYGAVARFSPNGTLDASYGVGGFATGAEGTTFAMLALQADERIIATDGPYTYRFAESGEPDPTFGAGGELQIDFAPFPTAYAQSAMLDDDGRLLSAVSDGENFQMSRIDSDGTLDATFNGAQQQQGFPGFAAVPFDTNAPYVLAAAAAHDRIFAVGILDVTAQAGSTMLLARFNSDASFDTTYGDTAHPGWTGLLIDTGGTSYNDPYALANDRAGRVLVGGYFLGDTIGRCSGIVRIIPDDLFNDGFDPPLPRVCPP